MIFFQCNDYHTGQLQMLSKQKIINFQVFVDLIIIRYN